MPVIIDHTAFPDIIDRIIAYAPPDSLKALSTTSWSFRRRILHHAVLHPARRTRKLSSKHPPFVIATPGGQRLPFIPAAVRILDLASVRLLYRPGAHAFTSVDTLRRMNGTYHGGAPRVPSAKTVVDFVPVHLSSLTNTRRAQTIYVEVPMGTTKYVLHMRMVDVADEDDPIVPVKTDIKLSNACAKVDNLVFVVVIPEVNDHAQLMMYAVMAAIASAINPDKHIRPVSLTIVGLERLESPPTHDELWKQLDRKLWWADQMHRLEIRDHMRLVTMDGWWEELGERKGIEGVWPAKRGDRAA